MEINGKEIASQILESLKQRVEKLRKKGIIPNLYIILLSDDESSASYVKQKQLKGEEIGVKITLERANPNITTDELIKKIETLNDDNSVHGIIVQRPMPKHLDEKEIEKTVIPDKDVDGFNPDSKFSVPVAMAVIELLKRAHPQDFENWLRKKKITVIGRGLTAGGPIIKALGKMGIEPQVISHETENPQDLKRESDIIISAVGKPNIVDELEIKKGTILIGVGMHREEDNKFHGDYDEEEIKDKASFYTPTPKGVGPVNVSMLLTNLVSACERQS